MILALASQRRRTDGEPRRALAVGLRANRFAVSIATATALWLGLPAHSAAAGQPAIAAQPNGKLLVTVTRDDQLSVARLHRDGRVDRSFGRRGFAATGIGPRPFATDLLLDPSGAIYLAAETQRGSLNPRQFVVRLKRNGKLDRDFGDGGIAQPLVDRRVSILGGLVSGADGQLLIGATAWEAGCGSLWNCQQLQLVASLDSDGALDQDFGDGGVATIPRFGTEVELAVSPDGAIVMGSWIYTASDISRVTSEGSLDPSFGDTGSVLTAAPVSDVAVAPDGRIYAGGSAETLFGVAALKPEGGVEERFASGGLFTRSIGKATRGRGSLLRQADGRLLLAGPVARNCRPRNPASPDRGRCRLFAGVLKLHASGEPVARFGKDGLARVSLSRFRTRFDPSYGVQVTESRGGLRVAVPIFRDRTQSKPWGTSGIAVAALRKNGKLDRRFGKRGLAVLRIG